MDNLKSTLINNNWFTDSELKTLLNSEIDKCIKECVRPNKEEIFSAFDGLKPQQVKVLIIGQDPYPDKNNNKIAHGLAFSSKNNSICPDSLTKIFEEIKREYQNCEFNSNNLLSWKEQGVLLLNTALTYSPNIDVNDSAKIWKDFVNAVIDKILSKNNPIVVMLWGDKAKKAFGRRSYDDKNVLILKSSHPKPRLLKHDTFKGCNHFIKCNDFLKTKDIESIQWWKTN